MKAALERFESSHERPDWGGGGMYWSKKKKTSVF